MAGAVEPEISVVMPVRNGGAWIARQLDALAATRLTASWELVISDNGSTDDTRSIVAQYARRFPVPLVVVDSADPPGVCHARNAGVAAARARLIAFCDCDDVVDPGWLAAARTALGRYDVVSGRTHELRGDPSPDAPILNRHVEKLPVVIGCNFAVRREAYYAVGGFDESLPSYGYNDTEFSLRARRAGLSFGHEPTMVIHFAPTRGLRSTVRKVYRSAVAQAIVWQRHPAVFPRRIGLGNAIRSVVRLPRDLLAMRRRGSSLRRLAREIVGRVAHIASYPEIRRLGSRPARLVFDDPRG